MLQKDTEDVNAETSFLAAMSKILAAARQLGSLAKRQSRNTFVSKKILLNMEMLLYK